MKHIAKTWIETYRTSGGAAVPSDGGRALVNPPGSELLTLALLRDKVLSQITNVAPPSFQSLARTRTTIGTSHIAIMACTTGGVLSNSGGGGAQNILSGVPSGVLTSRVCHLKAKCGGG